MVLSLSNLKRTWYYLQKNGLRAACLAAAERLEEARQAPYRYEPPAPDVLEAQKKTEISRLRISVAVPVFRPGQDHLTALLDSLLAQTYPHWELVLADAGGDGEAERLAERWAASHGVSFERIAPETDADRAAQGGERNLPETKAPGWRDRTVRYLRLRENRGISTNTNAGLACARGDYTGLLDHDDLLTPDALFEMAAAVEAERQAGRPPAVLYSDEDKCDAAGVRFFEPHRKPDFDPDLLLSNNYICHFLVMESGLIRALGMREAYEGAQDYDLVLRAASRKAPFYHVKKILYHWRCHEASTAQNPRSKAYAYEAGKRAVEAFLCRAGWKARVSHLQHLGFYRADYEGDIFAVRADLGAVARPLPPERGRFRSGIYENDGRMRFEGLRSGFSGPMHRAALQQEAETADLRAMRVRPELEALYRQALERAGRAEESGGDPEAQLLRQSRRFCGELHNMGYRILWDPQPETARRERGKR